MYIPTNHSLYLEKEFFEFGLWKKRFVCNFYREFLFIFVSILIIIVIVV